MTRLTLVVLLAVIALFLSDVIVSSLLPRLLAHGAQLKSIFVIILYAIPNGLFIALPMALLIGVYIVVLKRRERNEFQIFAGFGRSITSLVATTLAIGCLGALLSLTLSGFVEPSARYLLIRSLEAVAIQAIRDGELSSGRFYDVGDTTFYATSGRLNRTADNIFMYREREDDVDSVIVAGRLFNAEFSEIGRVGILLNNVNIYDLPDRSRALLLEECADCSSVSRLDNLKHAYFQNYYMRLPAVNTENIERPRQPQEYTFFDILELEDWSAGIRKIMAERLLRAALCVVTPFIALLAVAMTHRATIMLALPISAGAVLGLSFLVTNNVDALVRYETVTVFFGLLAGTLVAITVFVLVLRRLSGRFVRSNGLSL